MSFHPLMVYDATHFQKSDRRFAEEGPPFTLTPDRRAKLDEILTKYPPNQKRSAVLAALYLVQDQQGYISSNGMRHVAPLLDLTPAEVEDVATYYVMFFKEKVGKYVLQVCRTLSCGLGGGAPGTPAGGGHLGKAPRGATGRGAACAEAPRCTTCVNAINPITRTVRATAAQTTTREPEWRGMEQSSWHGQRAGRLCWQEERRLARRLRGRNSGVPATAFYLTR